jgi:class 3 adenylate cyclase
VVVFSGHMVDHPDRVASGAGPARFPDSDVLAGLVASAIDAELDRLQPLVGFCSAACGGDILFAERLLARGAELHVLLPFDKDDFRYTSVDYGRPELAHWRPRFERVLAHATEVHHATREHFLGDDVLFGFANTVLHGLALTRAAELDAELCGLLLLDETSQRVAGGTADVRAQWGAAARPAQVIDLAALRAAAAAAAASPVPPGGDVAAAPAADAVAAAPPPATVRPAGRTRRQVKVMLFSDVKNFSKLREEQTPSFFAGFLREVRRVIRSSPAQPEFLNTWGDGLFLVFDGVVECADFAMRLIDRIETIKWERLGLPPDTTVRIGIHAGPVYPRWDAIIERMNYFGSHVNRAARTEPVTTPGCAFTSEQFAALLAVAPDHDYVCEYVGVEQLAKEYDRCALYRLTRRPGTQQRRSRRPSVAAPTRQRRSARA